MIGITKAEYRITLNEKKVFTAKPDESIFNAALRPSLTLNHSCLNGRCNSCNALVKSDKSVAFRDEIGLSQEEVKEGNILTCSRFEVSDLNLFVDEFVDEILPLKKRYK